MESATVFDFLASKSDQIQEARMMDRYTKTILTVIAVALVFIAVQLQSENHEAVQAQAAKPQAHCVWSYIQDQGRPNLGKDGLVDLKDNSWKRASEEGWQLKAAANEGVYVFERCE
jgi:hypothetical protein